MPAACLFLLGDGFNDIPSFRFVKRYGGTAICVFDPERHEAKERAMQMCDDVDLVVPADYRRGSELFTAVITLLKRIYERNENTAVHQYY